jgi:hypothetical protein
MRVKMGGAVAAVARETEEDLYRQGHIDPFSSDETDDHFIDLHGSVVARIAARFEAGEAYHRAITASMLQAARRRASTTTIHKSCFKTRKDTEHKKFSVSFCDESNQIISVERFHDSYYIVDDDDEREHHSPVPYRPSLPDDMFTPEESPQRFVSSSLLSLPIPPLFEPNSPMSVTALVDPGGCKIEREAATIIQRIARGWMQRLKYRLLWLEHRIATHAERTKEMIDEINKQTQQRKVKMRKTLMRECGKDQKRGAQTNTLLRELQHVGEFLKKENNHLREKIQERADACRNLQYQNARIIAANRQSDEIVAALAEHSKNQQIHHKQLLESIPDYKAAVDILQTALDEQTNRCRTEIRIKSSYRKYMARIVDKISTTLPLDDLTDQVMSMAIEGDDLGLSHHSESSWNDDDNSNHFLDDSWAQKSFSQMSRKSLVHGLSESVAALHYESDSDDEDVKQYASGTVN